MVDPQIIQIVLSTIYKQPRLHHLRYEDGWGLSWQSLQQTDWDFGLHRTSHQICASLRQDTLSRWDRKSGETMMVNDHYQPSLMINNHALSPCASACSWNSTSWGSVCQHPTMSSLHVNGWTKRGHQWEASQSLRCCMDPVVWLMSVDGYTTYIR